MHCINCAGSVFLLNSIVLKTKEHCTFAMHIVCCIHLLDNLMSYSSDACYFRNCIVQEKVIASVLNTGGTSRYCIGYCICFLFLQRGVDTFNSFLADILSHPEKTWCLSQENTQYMCLKVKPSAILCGLTDTDRSAEFCKIFVPLE